MSACEGVAVVSSFGTGPPLFYIWFLNDVALGQLLLKAWAHLVYCSTTAAKLHQPQHFCHVLKTVISAFQLKFFQYYLLLNQALLVPRGDKMIPCWSLAFQRALFQSTLRFGSEFFDIVFPRQSSSAFSLAILLHRLNFHPVLLT